MRIEALAITTVAAASLLLGACASTGTDTSTSGSSRTASGASSTSSSSPSGPAGETRGGSTGSDIGGASGSGNSDMGTATGDGQRVADARGTSKTFDCENGSSFIATYDDPAYDGATSIAMQAGGAAASSNLQVSLGEDTATLTDGATTISCRARP